MPWFWKNPDNQRYLVDGLLASLPGLVALSAYGVRLIARLPLVLLPRLLLGALFLGATIAPQLLNFVGWDSARWNTISFFAAFCCIAALRLRFPPRAAADPRRYRIEDPWAITLAAAGIVAGLTADYPSFPVRWLRRALVPLRRPVARAARAHPRKLPLYARRLSAGEARS